MPFVIDEKLTKFVELVRIGSFEIPLFCVNTQSVHAKLLYQFAIKIE